MCNTVSFLGILHILYQIELQKSLCYLFSLLERKPRLIQTDKHPRLLLLFPVRKWELQYEESSLSLVRVWLGELPVCYALHRSTLVRRC